MMKAMMRKRMMRKKTQGGSLFFGPHTGTDVMTTFLTVRTTHFLKKRKTSEKKKGPGGD